MNSVSPSIPPPFKPNPDNVIKLAPALPPRGTQKLSLPITLTHSVPTFEPEIRGNSQSAG